MEEEVYHNLLSKYVSNELSLEETDVLLEWLSDHPENEVLLRNFQETWDLTKNYPENFKVDTSAAWFKLRSSLKEVEPPKGMHMVPLKKWMGIIAAFILFAIFIILAFKYFVIG
jgi:hypothetical protein